MARSQVYDWTVMVAGTVRAIKNPETGEWETRKDLQEMLLGVIGNGVDVPGGFKTRRVLVTLNLRAKSPEAR